LSQHIINTDVDPGALPSGKKRIVSFALWFQAAGWPHLIDTIAFPRASHSRQQPGPALFVASLWAEGGNLWVIRRCATLPDDPRSLQEVNRTGIKRALDCSALLVSYGSVGISGGLACIRCHRRSCLAPLRATHTGVELTRSASILAPSNLPPEPETVAVD